MQDFHRLRVWERAHSFALETRRVTHCFPRVGYADLKAQLVRAAESIPANIVEGSSATSPREFARFLEISIKSATEVEYHLLLARDQGILRPNR